MASSPLPEEETGVASIDPLSRQILQRTSSHQKSSSSVHNASVQQSLANLDHSDGRNPESESLRRLDTEASSKPGRDKKKGVSFLSRIMGNKKREGSIDMQDSASIISDNRPAGNDAEVFSQPVGFIPKFPPPPKYIRVKAYNRQKRDLDRLFLAQVLMNPDSVKEQRRNNQVDSKILGIGEKPIIPPPNSSRKSNNAVWAAEFSHDGKYFAAAGQDKKVRVWEVVSAKETKDVDDDQSDVESVNGTHVKLNAPVFKQRLVREYEGHTAAILDLSWSKNNFLLSSSMDKTVRLYHISREDCLCAFKHTDFVTSIEFHPRDDRFFLAGSLDAKLRLWSIPDKSVAYWAQVPDMITAVAFTPDGKTAIAGCLTGLCILYDTEGLKAHSQIHVRSTRGRNTKGSKITGIDTIAIPRDQGDPCVKLLITSNDSRIRMYNLKDRQLEVKFRGNENTTSQIRATFSDDGQFVICGSEDRKVYVWPTGPVEKQDSEKRPMEVFEAHCSSVTVATFAPTSARRLLAQAGDPIYDVCNPPPVVLMSRTDSVLSSPAPTHFSSHSDEKQENGEHKTSTPPVAPENPIYTARSAHKGGFIIVTADQSGQIKVFREDCAHQRRRDAFCDTSSIFSKKMLGRSGSINTRTSATSSTRRSSLNLSTKSPSTDRILNWRNSIATSYSQSNGVSDFSMRRAATDRERSSSPRKSLSHRFSLRASTTPLAQSSAPSSPDKPRHPSSTPEITVVSPDSSTPHSPQVGTPEAGATPALSALPEESSNPASPAAQPPTKEVPSKSATSPNPQQPFASTEENPLLLVEGRSYLAWDTGTLTSMLRSNPRTPGLSADGQMGNPMSRAQSYISQLSSERGDSSISGNDDDHNIRSSNAQQRTTARLYQRQISTGTTATNDEEELQCKSCGSEQFRMVKLAGGGRGLKCRSCNTVV